MQQRQPTTVNLAWRFACQPKLWHFLEPLFPIVHPSEKPKPKRIQRRKHVLVVATSSNKHPHRQIAGSGVAADLVLRKWPYYNQTGGHYVARGVRLTILIQSAGRLCAGTSRDDYRIVSAQLFFVALRLNIKPAATVQTLKQVDVSMKLPRSLCVCVNNISFYVPPLILQSTAEFAEVPPRMKRFNFQHK